MTSLSAVTLPVNYGSTIKTGIDHLDQIFGYNEQTQEMGFVRSKLYLISAPAGLGKSRGLLTIQDLITKNDPNVITGHFTSEQDVRALRSMLDKMEIVPVENLMADEENDWRKIKEKILRNHIQFVVIDSLPLIMDSFPKVKDEDSQTFREMKVKEKMKEIADFTADHNLVTILINHCTKAGQWKGSTDINHLVDVNITLSLGDSAKYDGMKVVEFKGNKNREGAPVFRAFPFNGKFDFSMPMEIESSTDSSGQNNDAIISKKKADNQDLVLSWFEENKELTRETLTENNPFELPEYAIRAVLKDLVTMQFLTTEKSQSGTRGKPSITKWNLVVDNA